MTNTRVPGATVVVVAICGARHLARCLDALAAQESSPPFDIVVAYDPRLTDVPIVAGRYPRVRLAATGNAQTPPELAARAIPAATGDLVLLTEDHCEPDTDWVRRLLESYAPGQGAIGGTVDARPGASLVDWAFFFADFFRFAPPVAPGPSRALTVCNVAYRRIDLEAGQIDGRNPELLRQGLCDVVFRHRSDAHERLADLPRADDSDFFLQHHSTSSPVL